MSLRKNPRIIVDTSVLISFYVYPSGIVRKIIEEAESEKCLLGVSEAILEEFRKVLSRKFEWDEELIIRTIGQIRRKFHVASPAEKLEVVKADPSDNKIIEAAAGFDADYIISGDSHLLDIGRYKNIKIIKASDLLKLLK